MCKILVCPLKIILRTVFASNLGHKQALSQNTLKQSSTLLIKQQQKKFALHKVSRTTDKNRNKSYALSKKYCKEHQKSISA